MVLDPIPQSLPVRFFGSRPQPPTSPYNHVHPYPYLCRYILIGDVHRFTCRSLDEVCTYVCFRDAPYLIPPYNTPKHTYTTQSRLEESCHVTCIASRVAGLKRYPYVYVLAIKRLRTRSAAVRHWRDFGLKHLRTRIFKCSIRI